MLSPATSWWFFFIVGVVVGGWTLFKRRPSLAVGVCAALSLLSPTWVSIGTEPFEFDVRISLACLMLIAYCFHPLGTLRYPQNWLDAVVLTVIIVHTFVDVMHGNAFAPTLLRAIGEWSVPYLAGRCSVLFQGGVIWLAPWFSASAIVIGLGALIESLVGVNLWEFAFGEVDDLVQRSRELRYGILYRAAGPTRHPIFLAIVLMLLVPWSVAQAEQGASWWSRLMGWVAMVMIVIGMAATVSRGPLIGLALAGVIASSLRWPRTRLYFAMLGIAAAALVALFGSQLRDWVEKTDSAGGRGTLVEVDDEVRVYTGTRNRLMVLEIYGPLVVRGGLFGYGTAAVSSFPPNIPGLPKSAQAAETLGIVDNSYLLFGLRFGWIGLSLLVTLLVGAISMAIARRRSAGLVFYPYGAAFATALASILTGVALEIATVFFSYEFAYWILFHCGVSAGLASLNRRLLNGAQD